MRKLFWLFLFVPAMAFTQVSNPSIISVATTPTGSCSAGLPNQQVVSTGVQYSCQGGTWAAIGGGGGSVSGQANGVIPLATGATAIGAQSHLDDGLTTPGTITSTEPICVGTCPASGANLTSTGLAFPGAATVSAGGTNQPLVLSPTGNESIHIVSPTYGIGWLSFYYNTGLQFQLGVAAGFTAFTNPGNGYLFSNATFPTGGATSILKISSAGSVAVPSSQVFSFSSGADLGTVDTGISRSAANVLAVGNGTAGNASGIVNAAALLPGILYSSAGTALPTCGSTIKGQSAVVSDATSPTYMVAYTSGGAITAAVICSYNGTTYAWLTH